MFNGLEALGLDDILDVELFKKKEQAKSHAKKEDKPVEYIYAQKRECPCCGEEFTNYAVRQSKARYVKQDTDLRSYFEPFDPLYYDALICPKCGYAAMSAFFNKLTDKQADLVKEQVSRKFKAKEYPLVYTPADAIERGKLALYVAVVKKARDSEIANICLKLSWLHRDAADKTGERMFAGRALEGFLLALEHEEPPICGLDSPTVTYLIAELYRRQGDNSKALKWVSMVLSDRTASRAIKDKAMLVKEMTMQPNAHANA